jgi:cytosine/adenosine deaminase-related metal-dependent hydrolase
MGHRASGLASSEPRAGTIADGAPADLVVFDDDPLAQLDGPQPEASLVLGSPAHRPRHVIARGRVLMRDGRLTTIDEDDLRDRFRAYRRELAA